MRLMIEKSEPVFTLLFQKRQGRDAREHSAHTPHPYSIEANIVTTCVVDFGFAAV